ncbi:ribonuclease H-like domain-containing protein [bacterium]|nr:ribonuclease H-like domain-containing protein [bacterium]
MISKEKKISDLQKLVDAIVVKDRAQKKKHRPQNTRIESDQNDYMQPQQLEPDNSGAGPTELVKKTWTPPVSGQIVPIDQIIRGEYRSASDGHVFIAEEHFPVSYRHGKLALQSAFEIEADELVFLTGDPDLHAFDLLETLFLDTETTGLSFTTGTWVFLVGCGFFQTDEFIVRQYFMQHYDQEQALIELLEHDLDRFKSLVTFNGRQFDLPLLKMRFMVQAKRLKLADQPHCDLLTCARRLWKKKLRWCNLGNLETQLLGLEREDDVPGSLIPDLYTQFVRNQNGLLIERVFYHNKLDILSMVTLLALVHQTIDYKTSERDLSAEELFSLACVHIKNNHCAEAMVLNHEALNRADSDDLKMNILKCLGFLAKRGPEPDSARQYWEQMKQLERMSDLAPLEELAKYFEHARNDYDRALNECDQALALLEKPPYTYQPDKQHSLRQSWLHRRERLQRKIDPHNS